MVKHIDYPMPWTLNLTWTGVWRFVFNILRRLYYGWRRPDDTYCEFEAEVDPNTVHPPKKRWADYGALAGLYSIQGDD
jgi:hypothetical protein